MYFSELRDVTFPAVNYLHNVKKNVLYIINKAHAIVIGKMIRK